MGKCDQVTLDQQLLSRHHQVHAATGHRESRFYQWFTPHCKRYIGGVAAVRKVLNRPNSEGLERLKKAHRPDLAVEALVLDPKWEGCFDDRDRKLARANLSRI